MKECFGGRTAFHGDGITECKRARVRGRGFSRIPIESLFRRAAKTELAARSVGRSPPFQSRDFPSRARLCVASVRTLNPQLRGDMTCACSSLPRFHVRLRAGAGGGGENSHVKTVGEKNLEEEEKRPTSGSHSSSFSNCSLLPFKFQERLPRCRRKI